MVGNTYPLSILTAVLTNQIWGWCMGEPLFEDANHEAMLFVCAAGYISFMGWFLWKVDESEADPVSYTGRTIWILCVLFGVAVGISIRMAIT